jgi:hypothetical protein
MNLNLNDDQLRAVIAGAVLQTLTPENRETILAAAVANLLTPQKESWQRQASSPLQDAFNAAITNVAREICHAMVKEDETIRAQIRGLIAKAVEKAFADPDAIADRLANNLGDLLARDRG